MLSFDKIVNKMWKKWWKILFKRDIFEIIDPECKACHNSFVNKVIYQLRAKNIIVPLRAWVYVVAHENDSDLNKIDLLEKYLIQLIKKYITHYCGAHYYVSWTKALEFHLKDYSIPNKIFIVTRDMNKKIKLWEYEIIFKTLSWKYQWKKINLYSRMAGYTKNIDIEWVSLKISSIEIALLESALVSDIEQWLQFGIINKAIKKYGWIMDSDIFYEVGKYKYIMSFNRLKEMTKTVNPDLYQVFLDVIKQNGGCFVGEWLRGI